MRYSDAFSIAKTLGKKAGQIFMKPFFPKIQSDSAQTAVGADFGVRTGGHAHVQITLGAKNRKVDIISFIPLPESVN